MSEIRFEKLSRVHSRKTFDCGEQSLNEYIQKYARQNARKNLGETYVLANKSNDILGFYTISTASLNYDLYPESDGLPRYTIPSALIGRLAVDKRHSGNGYGALLLVDALKKIVRISEEIGIHCITVDAKNKEARNFYQHFGFEALPDEKNHLYISIDKVKKAMF